MRWYYSTIVLVVSIICVIGLVGYLVFILPNDKRMAIEENSPVVFEQLIQKI